MEKTKALNYSLGTSYYFYLAHLQKIQYGLDEKRVLLFDI